MTRLGDTAWIDIDYPPQVQYLTPFKAAFERRGLEVLLTARDVGATLDLLEAAGVDCEPIGSGFGRGKAAKAVGTLVRARDLAKLARRHSRPRLLLSPGRSATLAARRLGIPSFAILDYEYVHVGVYRAAKAVVFFPDVIDPASFTARGLDRDRLVPFPGLKEDISFSGVAAADVAPYRVEGVRDDLVRVLVRPPTEESHYYRSSSRELTLAALRYLSSRPNVVVLLAPRHPWQALDLERYDWRHEPIVLDRPVPFVPLLKGVDVVVASGGTMLREAAYLGVPAYSIFQGEIGQVDRYLQRSGRIDVLRNPSDFSRLQLRRRDHPLVAAQRPELVDTLVDEMLTRSERG